MNTEEKILSLLEKQGDLLKQMATRMDKLEAGQSQMQDDLATVKARLELDVEKRFDAVNEGIDAIQRKLKTLDEVKELTEETRDRVDVIQAVVTQHSATITELKKAK